MKLLSVILAIAFTLGIIIPVWAAQDEGAKNILKQGILGAGVGAVAAGASGGKAGKGALIGAGANIAGEAIMGALTAEPQPSQQVQQVQQIPGEGTAPSLYQQAYQSGYQKGFQDGYQAGLAAAKK